MARIAGGDSLRVGAPLREPGDHGADGTNTWILRAPPPDIEVVVDPAQHKKHVKKVVVAGHVVLTLITHRHHDHIGAIGALHKRTGAPVRAKRPSLCRGRPAAR